MRDGSAAPLETPHRSVRVDASAAPAADPDRPADDRRPSAAAIPRPLHELWLLPRNAAIAFMLGYRRVVSPMYGQVCRYHPSCSRYALESFQRQGFVIGSALTIWRLLRCNPFTRGGIDDPPERTHPNVIINPRGFVRPAVRKA